ncbi:MAG: prepilin-type N-terminal cleavage/methylation domain-containing protein [Phormidium sp.]
MKRIRKQQEAGFTLIEMIVVVVLVAILATIATPSFLTFLTRQRLSDAQAEAMSAIREAQAKAKQQKRFWEVCVKDDNAKVAWFTRPVPQNNPDCSTNPGYWNNLIGPDADKIQIDVSNSSLTNGYYNVKFKPNGWVDDQTQTDPTADVKKITFQLRNQGGGSKRCVYVATLLGAVRTASNDDCKK